MGKFEKVIAGFVGFATAVTMSFGTASAATTEELQAQIASLLATIQGLQAQLGTATTGTTATAGYTFSKDLTVGSRGTDVTNLQNVVGISPATGYFGALTKAAVIKFQAAHSITPAAGYVGAKTRAFLNTMGAGTTSGGTTPTTPVVIGSGTTLAAALSYDTPAAGTIIAGQAVADLAHFTFSNPTGVEQKVTKIVMNRTGISNDSTLANVYLFNGAKRLTDSATVSVTKITFNDASGLFTVPAGGMVTISVKADIAASTSGQIIGVSLASVDGSVAVNGAYPILGNNQSIATADMATVIFSASMSPSTADIDPQNEYVMWQNTVAFGTREVMLKAMNFRQIGSVTTSDIGNFKLFVDGTQVGSTVASMDANGYVTFDLMAAPKSITTGSHTLKLVGDIIGGSTKTFSFSLQNAGDAVFVDSQVGQPILATITNTTTAFSARTGGTETINGGTLSITKKADSPSGNITKTATNALMGRFELKAAGEPIKVENLRISGTISTSGNVSLRNGTVFANGVQVGNAASILEDGIGLTYTTFSFGSSLVVTPGTPVLLEVRADVYNDYASGTAIAAGDTIAINIEAGSSNLKKMNSLTYTSNSKVSGNSLSVSTGSLSGAKNSSYANQTLITPQTAYKLGSFTVTSSETEKVNLDTIALTFGGTNSGVATGLSDVYVVYGGKTTSIKSTVASTTSWSISQEMQPNTTMSVDVYGTMASTLVSTNTLNVSLVVSGTTADSATAATTGTAIAGQTLTVSGGSIAAAAVTDSTLTTKLVVGNTSPKVASFRFTALNDTYKITDIALLAAGGADGAGAIRSLTLKATGMVDKTVYLGTGYEATSSGMSINVPANDPAGTIVDVYANLNDVGTYSASSTADVSVTLDTYKTTNSVGTAATTATNANTNAQYIVKSVPTITLQSLPLTTLTAGNQTISRFTIAADAAGTIGWKKMIWTVAKSGPDITATSTLAVYDAQNNLIAGKFGTSTLVSEAAETVDILPSDSGVIVFEADNEQTISTSQTYSLVANLGGTMGAGKYITTSIANPSTTHSVRNIYSAFGGTFPNQGGASFVWTDRSQVSHSESTADWLNDYKVMNLPTASQTMYQ